MSHRLARHALYLLLAACSGPRPSEPVPVAATEPTTAPTPAPEPSYAGLVEFDGDAGDGANVPTFSTALGSLEWTPLVNALVPRLGVDYLELHDGPARALAGWRCDRARNRDACHQSYVTLQSPPERARGLGPRGEPEAARASFVVAEREGVFTQISTPRELVALVGTLESLSEAAFLVRLAGYELWRREGYGPITQATGQADGEGWLLTARTPRYRNGRRLTGAFDLHVLRVTRTGELAVQRTSSVYGMEW